MTDIENRKMQEMLALFEDLKKQVATKEGIIFKDDGELDSPEKYLNIDGFYPGYFKAPLKVLFVGRESRWVRACNRMETDPKDMREGGINANTMLYWRRIFYIMYGIRHEGKIPFDEIPYAEDIMKSFLEENNLGFAVINVSKYSNDTTSFNTDRELVTRFFEDAELNKRNYLREQLAILDPDVIISGNIGESCIPKKYIEYLFPDKDFSFRLEEKSTPKFSSVYNFSFKERTIPFIDLYHFSAFHVTSLTGEYLGGDKLDKVAFYDPVMKALFK